MKDDTKQGASGSSFVQTGDPQQIGGQSLAAPVTNIQNNSTSQERQEYRIINVGADKMTPVDVSTTSTTTGQIAPPTAAPARSKAPIIGGTAVIIAICVAVSWYMAQKAAKELKKA